MHVKIYFCEYLPKLEILAYSYLSNDRGKESKKPEIVLLTCVLLSLRPALIFEWHTM